MDARLVAEDCGYEILEGRLIEVPPALEPHGERHSKVNALLEAFVREDFNVACDMLTRTSKISDIAPDASVYPRARNPDTGGRQIEQLAFEVVSTQALSDAGDKARSLSNRGVRRVFAVDVPHVRVFEWSRKADDWELMPDAAAIDDPCLVEPLPVEALVKAARADDAMATALLAKRNPVLADAIEEGREEGRKEGREEGRKEGREEGRKEGREEGREEGRKEGRKEGREEGRRAGEVEAARALLRSVIAARGFALTAAQLARVAACDDLAVLETWASRAATADSSGEVF